MNLNSIITGERLQDLADVYIGKEEDFEYNPYICYQTSKQLPIEWLQYNLYDNPKIIFVYSHCVHMFSRFIHHLMYPFVLITHNSDENIVEYNGCVEIIVNCPNLIKWYAQNLIVQHPKMCLLPIGIANQQWSHGIQFIDYCSKNIEFGLQVQKTNHIYFNFSIGTNYRERKSCYDSVIKKGIPFLENIPCMDNIARLESYQYCICPEGNGVDTHRLWEALYLKCVPIVLKTEFIETLRQYMDLPMVVLNSWDELSLDDLHYDDFTFDMTVYEFNTIAHKILTSVE